MPDVGPLAVLTLAKYLDGITDAIIQDNVFLNHLRENGRMEFGLGGNGLSERVRKEASSTGGYTTDLGIRSGVNTNPFEEATNQFRPYRHDLQLPMFPLQRNANADNRSKLADMRAEQFAEFEQSATSHIGVACYGTSGTSQTGDDGTPIDGLEDMIDNDNTYWNLARSTRTYWQGQIQDTYDETNAINSANFNVDANNDGTQNGLEAMQRLYLKCCGGSEGGPDAKSIKNSLATKKEMPDIIITTRSGFQLYRQTLQAQFRYVDKDANPAKELAFENCKISWDTFCTSLRFYFLNTKYIKFYNVGKKLLDSLLTMNIPNPLSELIVIGGQHQLGCKNPRYQGALRLAS